MNRLARFRNWLGEQVDGRMLGFFRVVFGLLMLYQCYYYYEVQLIEKGFLAPGLLFTYDWFPYLKPLSAPVMHGILFAMAVGTALVTLGIGMRIGAMTFVAGQFYFLLLEKAYFNNHIYMFALMCVLLCFTHADHFVSLRRRAGRVSSVARWEYFILQAQVVIVYFYGGLTKLNPYWLFKQEPIRSLAAHGVAPERIFSGMLNNAFAVNLLTYGGLLLDLAGPLLWIKRFRNWIILFFIGFNFANSQIFNDIGVFPFVMLACLLLFFGAEELPLLRRLPGSMQEQEPVPATSPRWYRPALIAYFAFQLLFPFRGHLLPNPLDYTTIGNRFSWRMKVDTRMPEEMKVVVENPDTGETFPINLPYLINDRQMVLLAMDPRAWAQLGQFLKKEGVKRGVTRPVVKARVRLRYNGGPSQFYIEPNTNLAEVQVDPWKRIDWLVPPERK